ncbi:MAG: apolipoprotein N-acyltransferase [Candidatus Omnitrophota bacterium]|nr:MAG: apolipoprotein N-acyltransferase [Candidatus Omnitrophota bacterium]
MACQCNNLYQDKTYNLQHTTYNYFAIPSAWVILEYLRSHVMGGIGWNLLGYSQYKNLPIIQIADIAGVWGISFLIMLMNVAIYVAIKMAIKCYKKNPRLKIKGDATFKQELEINPVIQTLFVLILFIATLTYGHIVIASPDAKGVGTKQSSIKISVVQGNIQQMFKWDDRFKNDIMNRYNDLTIKATKDKPDLIIWPETAVPGYLNYDKELIQWIKKLIRRIKIPLLAGTPMISKEISGKSYNSAVLFSEKGSILGRYDKLHLVAFGEFIPFEKQFPFLRKLFPITGNFISGKEYTVFGLRTTNYELRTTNFSVLICFEDIFSGLVRDFVKRGADFMVNITNDAWFGKTCAAYQHAACSVLRAVENRRPFIRSANTGLSCFIDKTGKIYKKVSENNNDLFIQGIKTAYIKIGKDRHLTFYTKYGDVSVLLCVFILFICAGKIFLTIK